MSCHGLYIPAPNGKKICIPIYRIIDWRIGPPDPPEKGGPQPDPWKARYKDLVTLVTINDGLKTISDKRIRETLSEAVVGAARSIELPEGMELGDDLFNAQKPFLAAK